MAYETQQYISSLVLTQIKPPNVWWSPDYKTLTCEGYTCLLDNLQDGIQAIFHRCWELYDKITGGHHLQQNSLSTSKMILPWRAGDTPSSPMARTQTIPTPF